MSAPFHTVKVIETHHWTDRLFSFKTTRQPSFRFESGQFVMLGLENQGKPLMRAYSIASAHYDEHLEFFSVKVEDGPLTSILKHIRPGDDLFLGRKPTGTLLIHNLRPGRNLYLLGTGTGLAPFLSIVRDPETYERFENVVVAHGCRFRSDLAYSEYLSRELFEDEFIGDRVGMQLRYFPVVTREPSPGQPRLTRLTTSGQLALELGLPAIDGRVDRFMVCGSHAFLADMRDIFDSMNLAEGRAASPGDFVHEKAFVD